jgi:Mce-associated membrane protein
VTDDKPDTPLDLTKSDAQEAPAIDLAKSDVEEAPAEEPSETSDAASAADAKRGAGVGAVVALAVVSVVAVLLAAAAGYFGWQAWSTRDADRARTESVQTAKESTVALLSYKAETVDKDLGAARDRLTGSFLDAYTQLVNNVVIPGAKEKKISAVAQVPAAASVSVSPKGEHAVVLLFVNQTVVMGTDAPTNTTSSVRVTLDKVDGRWLISGFDPV